MDLEIVILNKVSQTERETYAIAFRWDLKKMKQMTILQNRNRLTDLENELVVNGGRLGERDN